MIQFFHKEVFRWMNHWLALCSIKECRRGSFTCTIELIDQTYPATVKVSHVSADAEHAQTFAESFA